MNVINIFLWHASYYKFYIIIITSFTYLSASQTRINSMCRFLIPPDVLNDMRTYKLYINTFVLLFQGSLYAHVNYVYLCTAIRQRRCSLKSSSDNKWRNLYDGTSPPSCGYCHAAELHSQINFKEWQCLFYTISYTTWLKIYPDSCECRIGTKEWKPISRLEQFPPPQSSTLLQ